MKKLLIISASAGSGHVRAAQALEAVAKRDYPELEIKHIDLVDYVGLATKKAFFDSYDVVVKSVPELYGYIFKQMEKPKNKKLFELMTTMVQKIDAKQFLDEIESFAPDHIISTHFTPPRVIETCSRPSLQRIPQTVVVTDYDLHQLWLSSPTTTHVVSTEKMKWTLMRHGIPEQSIVLAGIPVDPIFFEKKSKAACQGALGIDPNKKTVLVLSGGNGLIKIHKVVKSLFTSNEPLNIVAIAGKSKSLKRKLDRLEAPAHISFEAVGWTDKIDEYMHAADSIVTKPGGLTTSECLTLGKPMIIIDPIPGQEEQNAMFALNKGFGVIALNYDDIAYYAAHPPQFGAQQPATNPSTTILKHTLLS